MVLSGFKEVKPLQNNAHSVKRINGMKNMTENELDKAYLAWLDDNRDFIDDLDKYTMLFIRSAFRRGFHKGFLLGLDKTQNIYHEVRESIENVKN